MKWTRSTWLAIPLVALSLAACSDDDGATGPQIESYDFAPFLTSFSDNVAVPTYAALRDRAEDLHAAIAASNADPSNQALLEGAADAWRAAREPWEASEGFLFGPAAFLGLDPSLDSWPVDRQQLEQVLESDFELTASFIAEGLGPALRGFHTLEYLLFRGGEAREVSEITAREREYLLATSEVLNQDCTALWDAWASGYDGGAAYADELEGAGSSGSRYATQRDAVIEIIEGMIGICDEVANGKIADPYDERDPGLEESQFSYNSLDDFQNNLRSVQHAYLGRAGGTGGPGLDQFLEARSPALDQRLQQEIGEAISAIAAIPFPFRDHLDASAEIEAAQAAIMRVASTLDGDVRALVME